MASRYWCYQCSQMVNPILEVEIKCPFCQGGFIEEMASGTRDSQDVDSDIASDRALSLWAPILLGMMGSLGDYFIGPGLDLLLQHLAENDPNRYGTPPAQKDAIEALPTVKIEENLQCSVCLDDFEVGTEAKEMPCKHKFHNGCILPWLELHSSCPVCRYQLPADESKLESERSRSNTNQRETESNANGSGEDNEGDGRSGNSRRFSFPWPFNGLFSSGSSQSGGGNSSSTSSSSHTGSASQADEN
ncbi:Zinc finger, RING-type [Corchorus olitorius]|uniref:RING-type E3 ubiquitin transferase n=1 Tax=Corchorus olitorius TaxID=93759 RepID=A0A1R3GIB0_9ROSI|nr:Zinc finger, RING-type [Corchorus olitorius]